MERFHDSGRAHTSDTTLARFIRRLTAGALLVAAAAAICLAMAAQAWALEPPTKEQVEQYKKDGTLAARVEAAKRLGNQNVSPRLVKQARVRLERARLQAKGVSAADAARLVPMPKDACAGVPTTGTLKMFALLIAFPDYPPVNSSAYITSGLNGPGDPAKYPYESLSNFYLRSSYNQLYIQCDVLGYYTTSYPRSSVPETADGMKNLIKEALNYYETQGHDFSQYDNDGDGRIDYFAVFWTGPSGDWMSFWWSCANYWSDLNYILDGKVLDRFSWQGESPTGMPFGANTVIHETGHALGLPDYYDYNDLVGPSGGLGGYDMMDDGNADHNAFSKWLLGWVSPMIAPTGTTGTWIMRPSYQYGDCVLAMPNVPDDDLFTEYFLVQQRYRSGNDTDYVGDGVDIWHVDARLDFLGNPLTNNSTSEHKLLRRMEADGLEHIEQNMLAETGDLYTPGKSFGPATTPNSRRYDGVDSGVTVDNFVADSTSMWARVTVSQGAPMAITNANLPRGIAGHACSGQVAITGGTAPYTWSIASGSLPTGLSLSSSTGAITGTPTSYGSSSFTARVVDSAAVTATLAGAAWVSRDLSLTTINLPDGHPGVDYSAALTADGGSGLNVFSISSGSLPAGLTLNHATGAISGTPTALGTSSFTARVTAYAEPADTATEALSIRIISPDLPDLLITTASLPDGTVGAPYSHTFAATGGVAPYEWYLYSGTLGPGLTLDSATGVLSGTPTSAGTFEFTIRVRDSQVPADTATKTLSLTVVPSLVITTESMPDGTVGTPYSHTFAATGGVPPYTWSLYEGTFGPGLTLDSATGVLSGTPTSAWTYNFTIRVRDSQVPADTATKTLSLTVVPKLVITTTSLPDGQVGGAYSQTLTASGGIAPYSWSLWMRYDTLPAGLSLEPSTGVISGTPTASGTTSFTVQVKDQQVPADTVTKALSIVIAPADLVIATSSLPGGTAGSAYSQSVAATGGVGPYAWSLSSGSLPAGLSLSTSTGVISGNPTAAGPSSFTVQVTDSQLPADTATKALSINVEPAPLMITTIGNTLANAQIGVAYWQPLTAAGGAPPYTWSVSSGSLPAGLTLDAVTGVISGTPTTGSGVSSFTVRVVDSWSPQGTDTEDMVLLVPGDLSVATESLPDGQIDVAYSQIVRVMGGIGPYAWSLSSGSLPAGLSLEPSTGVISGTPTASGTASFTVQVTDANSPADSATKALSIRVLDLVITTSSLPGGQVGVAYSQPVIATGGGTPYAWSIVTGSLPSGLAIDAASGVISGTPTVAGTAAFSVQVSDAFQTTATRNLSIAIPGTIRVLKPNGGQVWAEGSTHDITWISNAGGQVRIDLYDGATLLTNIALSTENDGSFAWTVPVTIPAGTNYRVKVSLSTEPTIFDLSDGAFTIPAFIAVRSPERGTVWARGSTQTIRWISNAGGAVNISLYQGSSFDSVIATGVDNTGSFSWAIPASQAMATGYKVEVRLAPESTVYGTSGAFSIMASGTYVTVASPNGGEYWQAGSANNITWASDCEGGVKIQLYKAGSLDRTINASAPNTGSYSWTVPAGLTLGGDYAIKVTCASNSTLTDTSDAAFTIARRNVTVDTLSMDPTTARPGQPVSVTGTTGTYRAGTPWEMSRIVVGIRDSGGRWIGGEPVIVSINEPGGDLESHAWNGDDKTIAAPVKNGTYHFWALNSTAADDSAAISEFKSLVATSSLAGCFKWPASLVVSGQAITVTSPNGGEVWLSGSFHSITWTSYIGGDVSIDLYKGGTLLATLTASTPNNGVFSGQIPNLTGTVTNLKVKITSLSTSAYDYSDATFTISPFLPMQSPGPEQTQASVPAGKSRSSPDGLSADDKVLLGRLRATVRAWSSAFQGPAGNILDNNAATSWKTAGTLLQDKEFVVIDVHRVSRLGAVTLSPGADLSLFPTEFTIEVSSDKVSWKPVVYAKDFNTGAEASVWRFEPTLARYVRISGPAVPGADGRFYWMIGGTHVYRTRARM